MTPVLPFLKKQIIAEQFDDAPEHFQVIYGTSTR